MKTDLAVTRAYAFMQSHFREQVTLTQLAALSTLSVSRFVTVFRHRYGCSPYRYLCALRIQHAQQLLLDGMPKSHVAAEVGFFDHSHFARHFRRICGMTPTMFLETREDSAACCD